MGTIGYTKRVYESQKRPSAGNGFTVLESKDQLITERDLTLTPLVEKNDHFLIHVVAKVGMFVR